MELVVEKGRGKREGDERCRVTKATLRSWGFIVNFLGFLGNVLGEGRTACSLLHFASSACSLENGGVGVGSQVGRAGGRPR